MIWEETHLDGLRRRVRTVTRLGRARSVLVALAAGAVAGAGAFLLASALDVSFWLPTWMRLVALAGTVALVLYAALRWGVRSTRELGHEPEAARAVERRFPEIQNTLSTAIEFGSDPTKTLEYSSPEIVDTLVTVTDARTVPLSFPRAVDWRALARAAGLALALAVLIFVYAAALPQLAGATAKRLFAPLGDTPPPTWTVIGRVTPGDVEVQRGASQRIEVSIAGRSPESVRLLYRVPSDALPTGAPQVDAAKGREVEWSEVEMSPLGERSFARTLVNITRPVEYRVSAGDATSPVHRLFPFEEPRVESLHVRITPPAYTGLPSEDLPEGAGDVRAIAGTVVEVRARVSEKTAEAKIELKLRAGEGGKIQTSTLALEPGDPSPEADPRERRTSFALSHDGEYRFVLADDRGRTNRSEENAVFRLTAVPDRAPKVRVTAPERDVLAARDQEVTIEIEASDDWGLGEIGIVHTLSGKPDRIRVERPAPGTKKSSPSHKVRLGLHGFKGGEIIAYHGYARDNNDVTGPSETEGELRFIRTYGEERYGMQGGEMKTPRAAREVDRLIDRQMDVMREAFDLARRERAEGSPLKRGAAEAAASQDDVRRDLEELLRAIETEIDDKELAGGMMPQEIVFLRDAEKKMATAAAELREGRATSATAPQAEALSLLSRTRRIILSDSGSEGVGRAMEDAERDRQAHRDAERRRDLDELEREMRKMPPILEREKEEKRKLEKLEDEPPPPGVPGQMADEQRRLAEEAREQAQRLQEMGVGDESFPQEPARQLLEAADEMERSADAARRSEFGDAARSADRAAREISAAEAAARGALQSADRERMKGAETRAEDLARKQKDLQKRTDERTRDEPGEGETGMSAAEAAALAEEQEALRGELEDLGEEIESLAGRAEREGKAEAQTLRWSAMRQGDAESEMDAAARALRGARPFEAQMAQREAAKQLDGLANELREAAHRAESEERRALARAVERAEELAKEAGRLSREVRDPAQDPRGMTGTASRLEGEAGDIARAASLIPSRAGSGDIEKAKESLLRAEKELGRAGSAMGRPDRAEAATSLDGARRDAEDAASALRRSAAQDVVRALSDARAEARAAARKQEEVRDGLAARRGAAGGQEGEASVSPDSAAATARGQGEAARSERIARENVESAAETAKGLGSDLAELLEREVGRAERERLDERMKEFASALQRELERGARTGAEAREAAAAEDLRRGDGFVKETAEAAARLDSLFAEARDDEIESLRALAEDSRRLSDELRSLGERAGRAAGEVGEAEERSEEGEDAGLRELALDVRGLEDDAKGLRERLERRAPEILAGRDERTGEAPVGDLLASAERELLELGRRLSRNQRPRATNSLGTGAFAYQVVGDGVIEKLELLVKQRDFRPPEDEVAPEEFRELVEKYFRALSED